MLYIKNLSEFANPVEISLSEIIRLIKEDKDIKATCQKVRMASNDEMRRKSKFQLPAFVMGEFNERITNKDFIRAKYLLFDIDHIDQVQIIRAKAELKKFALFSFVSPSGKGLKFICPLKDYLTKDNYKGNYAHYANFFSDYLGLELDKQTKDPARKCYFAHDPTCELNPDAKELAIVSKVVVERLSNVDEAHCDNEELTEICRLLQTYPLSYLEWVMAAMALQDVPNGLDLFMILSKNKYYPNDTDDTIRQKFAECNSTDHVSIGTLYHLAMQRGFKRQKKYLLQGGSKYPFSVEKDGSYYRDNKDNYTWVFGFRSIQYLYDVEQNATRDGGTELIDHLASETELIACLQVDEKVIYVPASSLATGAQLKKEISKKMSIHFVQLKSDTYFTMLSEYLHRTKPGAVVRAIHGIGRVAPGLYNWGNYVIKDGIVYHYEPIIWENDKTGIMLDNNHNIIVHPGQGGKDKIRRLHYFYGDQICLALGWAIANVFFHEVMENFGCFPIFFIYGDSGKGKTKLATLMLAMFGVAHPESDKLFHNKLEDMSRIAGTRVKDSIFGFPTLYDEYNSKHYHLLKSLYDGAGRTIATKDTTNRVKRSSVYSGTITAAIIRPHEKEVLNRCIYFDISSSVDIGKSGEFDREYMLDGAHQSVSALAIEIALKINPQRYMELLLDAKARFMDQCCKTNEAMGRITTNYAVAYAGYRVLVDAKVIPEWVPIETWVQWIDETTCAIKEADPIESFLFLAQKFSMEGVAQQYLKVDRDSYNAPYTIVKDGIAHIRMYMNLKYLVSEIQEVCRKRQVYPDLLGMTVKDIQVKIRKSPYFIEAKSTSFYVNSYNGQTTNVGYAYVVEVPLNEKDEIEDVLPF